MPFLTKVRASAVASRDIGRTSIPILSSPLCPSAVVISQEPEDAGFPPSPLLELSPYPSAFPTHGFSHLSLRLAHTPLQHEVAPKSMGQGRNGVGMWWRALWLAMGLLGSPPPPKKKSEEKKIRGKENQFLGEKISQKLVFLRNGVARGCSGAWSIWQVFCPTNQTKKQIFPPK